MGKKSTNREIEERVQEVADYLLKWPLASDFDLHKEFCSKYEVVWQQINRYARRAKELNKKRVNMSRDEMAELGKKILMDLLKSPNEKIRVQAERSLREIAGYGAPPRIPEDAAGKPMQFVPLHVNPDEITGGDKS